MQVAALYGFARSARVRFLCIAHVTNTMNQGGGLEKGGADGTTRAALSILGSAIERLYPAGCRWSGVNCLISLMPIDCSRQATRSTIISKLPDQHGARLPSGRSFEMTVNRSLRLKPAVTQPENVIKPVENHFIMRDADDRSILFDGDPSQ